MRTRGPVQVTCLVHNGAATIIDVLDAIELQGSAVDRVVVVDNASTDGSRALLEAWRSADPLRRTVVLQDTNLGVGAGHAVAWSTAIDSGAELVWCLEHDSVPLAGCLDALLAARSCLSAIGQGDAVLAPRLYRNMTELTSGIGDPDRLELRRGRELAGRQWPALQEAGVLPVGRLTFNGVLMSSKVIERIGFPREDLFVGAEDWDWSEHARKGNVMLGSVRAARMLHRSKGDRRHGEHQSPSRTYYSVRNLLLIDPSATRSRAWASCCAGAVKLLVTGPDRRRNVIARIVGTRDGLSGRSGQRFYSFMTEPPAATPSGS